MEVTSQQLLDYTGNRPFLPFWISLKSGEIIRVIQPLKAVAGKTQFAVTTNGRTMRHIPISEINGHGLLVENKADDAA